MTCCGVVNWCLLEELDGINPVFPIQNMTNHDHLFFSIVHAWKLQSLQSSLIWQMSDSGNRFCGMSLHSFQLCLGHCSTQDPKHSFPTVFSLFTHSFQLQLHTHSYTVFLLWSVMPSACQVAGRSCVAGRCATT